MVKKGGEEGTGECGEQYESDRIGTAFIDGETFYSKEVQYIEVDGLAMLEGDIVLGTVEEVQRKTEMRCAEMRGEIAAGVVVPAGRRWPNCRIPYTIDSSLQNQARVTDAIAHWEANTRVRFVLRTAANQAMYTDYVDFKPGAGCRAHVGRVGGYQFVELGNGCSTGSTIHEIGHTVGLWHEQSREDRNAFVTINWANITPGRESNFNQHIADGDDVGAYDYGSIMHYPRTAFSRNGNETITPTNPAAVIGQRNGLSPGDIAAANSLCPRLFCPPAPRLACPPAPRRFCPPAPRLACPPAPRRFCPPAPRRLCPPAPRRFCPPAPRRLCPPAPRRFCPPAPRSLCPPAPRPVCPPAPSGCWAGPYLRPRRFVNPTRIRVRDADYDYGEDYQYDDSYGYDGSEEYDYEEGEDYQYADSYDYDEDYGSQDQHGEWISTEYEDPDDCGCDDDGEQGGFDPSSEG